MQELEGQGVYFKVMYWLISPVNVSVLPLVLSNSRIRYKWLPVKFSYLVSEVNSGSMLDQFPNDLHTPLPSGHHEGCLLRSQH